MAEKKINFFLVNELFWTKREKFIKLNPTGSVPLLVSKPDLVIFGVQPILEFLEDQHPEIPLIYGDPKIKADIRKTNHWFMDRFYNDSVLHILYERIYNFFKSGSDPDYELLKIARSLIPRHMNYIQFLLSKSDWLSGDEMSLSDISAACHISSLDYLGEINWGNYKLAKDWYSVIKSRPSFRPILQDNLSPFKPSPNYRNLDF